MVEYSEGEANRARRIVNDLLEGRGVDEGLEEGFSIVDVDEDVLRFREDLEIWERVGGRVPAMDVSDGPPVPIALSLILGINFPLPLFRERRSRRYYSRLFRELFEEDLYYTMHEGRLIYGDARWVSSEQARESFMLRATNFLASRLAAISRPRLWSAGEESATETLSLPQFFGGRRVQVQGCSFSVHTTSKGLTAHWSGAYYISSNYHGAPTTPAIGPLQAGTYIFGVTGGAYGNNPQWDQHAVCTLPGTPSVHLNF